MKYKTNTSTNASIQSLIHSKKLTQGSLFTLHQYCPGKPCKCHRSRRRTVSWSFPNILQYLPKPDWT